MSTTTCENRARQIVKSWIERKDVDDVNVVQSFKSDYPDCLDKYVKGFDKKYVDYDDGSSEGTLIHWGCICSKIDCLSFLISNAGENQMLLKFRSSKKYFFYDYDGLTPRQIAEKKGNKEMIILFSQRQQQIQQQQEIIRQISSRYDAQIERLNQDISQLSQKVEMQNQQIVKLKQQVEGIKQIDKPDNSTNKMCHRICSRQLISVYDSVLFLSNLVKGEKPLPLKEELQKMKNSISKFDTILFELSEWYDGWIFGKNPSNLDKDEVLAIALYTHDLLHQAPKEENFYYQLNNVLRKRNGKEMTLWQGYFYYILNALDKLPSLAITVYRGIPLPSTPEEKTKMIETFTQNYPKLRPIHWSGFSSASDDVTVAQEFAGNHGIIFRISIFSGKSIQGYSFLSSECEILLSPNMKFQVTEPIHLCDDGFYHIDLIESKTFVF